MGGGGHSTSSKRVNNKVNENISYVHNNVKNIDNYMQEHNIVTDVQYGDRALGGSFKVSDDVDAGYAYKNLINLDQIHLQNLNPLYNTAAKVATNPKAIAGTYITIKGVIYKKLYDNYYEEDKMQLQNLNELQNLNW